MDMSTKIKTLRNMKGLTQEELGDYLGVKKAAIQKYENGSIINLKTDTIKKLCTLFNVTPNFLMGYESNDDEMAINNISHLKVYNSLDKLNHEGLEKIEDYIEDILLIDKYRLSPIPDFIILDDDIEEIKDYIEEFIEIE